jgi:hypothetical protein
MKTFRNVCVVGLAVALVAILTSYAQAVAIGYWRFEEPEGSPALDSAGSNPGTLQVNTSRSPNVFGASVPSTGAANTQSMFFADTPGEQSGAAVDMRGTDPENPNPNPDRGLGDFTIEAWINRSGNNSDQYANIAGKFPSGPLGDTGWALYAQVIPEFTTQYKVALLSRLNGGDFRVAASSIFLDLGTWYHVAGVRDADQFRIYVDGVERGSITVSASEDYTAPMQSFSIGGSRSGTNPVLGANFFGYIDEVRLSDTALTPDKFLNGPLVVGLSGDYNNDGTVDAADYVLYRKGAELQNDPNPGNATAQYNQWTENFGMSNLGAGGSVATVPEPGCIVLVLGCLGLFCGGRGMRH